ncbi:MAG: helix-turn-helix domain-containing protein [Methanobacterium sp.]|jgi:sugar-specific transcriptional regulator TrmB
MIELPTALIKSLTSLGLLESEAKVYAALVILKSAGIKELLEFLDISKPQIYERLKMLKDKGLIILTNPRPITYQAISPNIALEMLVERTYAAKNDAVKQFHDLENNDLVDKSTQPLWFIYGDPSFEFKIRDMITNAKESIYCVTSEKNLNYIKMVLNKSIETQLIIISDNKELQNELEQGYNTKNVTITVIHKAEMKNLECTKDIIDDDELEIANIMDIDNHFILVVDNTQALFIPPLRSDSVNAISIENKIMVKVFMHNLKKEPFGLTIP